MAEWISLGAIPAAVPHTRPVPVLGTEASPGLLRGGVLAGPAGTLRVPSALVSALEFEVAAAGIPALGYFAQVPHYVSGPYATAALELLRAIGHHLGAELPAGDLGARRASCGPGWTRRPRPTRPRGPTSSDSRRCTTSSGCRRATT